jgi:hypothetical protein
MLSSGLVMALDKLFLFCLMLICIILLTKSVLICFWMIRLLFVSSELLRLIFIQVLMGFCWQVDDGRCYPVEFDLLVGMKLLFQVEKLSTSATEVDACFRVIRICDHETIIAEFDHRRLNNIFDRYCCFLLVIFLVILNLLCWYLFIKYG